MSDHQIEAEPIDPFMLELQKEFLNEAGFLLEACEESYLKLDNPECRAQELDKIFRAAHSFKGTGASVGLKDLAAFAHIAEDCLSVLRVNPALVNAEIISLLLRVGDAFKERVRQLLDGGSEHWAVETLQAELIQTTEVLKARLKGEDPTAPVATPTVSAPPVADPQSDSHPSVSAEKEGNAEKSAKSSNGGGTTVKVDAERIDSVLDMIGEIVVTKSQLAQSYREMNIKNAQHDSVMALLDKSIRELQDRAMSMRLTSMKPLFLRIQRAVRDLTVKLGKPVDFTMSGEDVEIDRTMIEMLGDPLVHIARNAVDHGIEKPEKRTESGKNPTAKIHLSARQSGGRVLIEIRDDGGGIHPEKVIQKAKEKGILPENTDPASLAPQEVYRLLFAPGFSTAEVISDVSGRGVGLDVVRSNIEKLKGTVEVESKVGAGTTFRIGIPLTAAITDGMLVSVGGDRYIMPLDVIRELIRVDETEVTRVSSGVKIIHVRGNLLPLINTEEVLYSDKEREPREGGGQRALVVESAGKVAAFVLDQVLGQVQVVVKPLPDKSTQSEHVSGTAILGDGRVALVLNVDGFFNDKKVAAELAKRVA